jgi:hypothetical protein
VANEKKKYLLINVTGKGKKGLDYDEAVPTPSIIDNHLVEKDSRGRVKRVRFERLKYDHT